MAHEQEHVELVVELKPGADAAPVASWLAQHGLATLPLVVGILASGDAKVVRAVFGAEPSGILPIPQELSEHVVSIAAVPAKRAHETT